MINSLQPFVVFRTYREDSILCQFYPFIFPVHLRTPLSILNQKPPTVVSMIPITMGGTKPFMMVLLYHALQKTQGQSQ